MYNADDRPFLTDDQDSTKTIMVDVVCKRDFNFLDRSVQYLFSISCNF